MAFVNLTTLSSRWRERALSRDEEEQIRSGFRKAARLCWEGQDNLDLLREVHVTSQSSPFWHTASHAALMLALARKGHLKQSLGQIQLLIFASPASIYRRLRPMSASHSG